MKSKLFGAAVMAAIMAVPAFAQDDTATKKKGQRDQQNVAMQTIKQLEEVKLTDEQVAKIKELGKTVNAKMKELRDEAGITPALLKKRAEAQKSMKDSDKKGKDLQAAINEAAGFTEAQSAAIAKVNEARTAFGQTRAGQQGGVGQQFGGALLQPAGQGGHQDLLDAGGADGLGGARGDAIVHPGHRDGRVARAPQVADEVVHHDRHGAGHGSGAPDPPAGRATYHALRPPSTTSS